MTPHLLTYDEFLGAHLTMDQRIHLDCSEEASARSPLADGAIKPGLYWSSPVRIVWLLKEAYDSTDTVPHKGPRLYGDLFDDCDIYDNFIRLSGSRKTWTPISYVSYSLLNDFMPYQWIDDIKEDKAIADCITSLAIMNLKKIPGRTNSVMSEIHSYAQKHTDLITTQIQLLHPHIVIGGNTLWMFHNALELCEPAGILENSKRNYFLKDQCLYIDAFHPAKRGEAELYVQEIIDVAQKVLGSR